MKKGSFSKIGLILGLLPALALPLSAYASLAGNNANFNDIKAGGGTSSNAPLPVIIGQLIGLLLSVLGVILVVYIIQAGIMYMTAAGDATKVDKAKKIMTQAIIGLIIIVSAYAIANFVIANLSLATS